VDSDEFHFMSLRPHFFPLKYFQQTSWDPFFFVLKFEYIPSEKECHAMLLLSLYTQVCTYVLRKMQKCDERVVSYQNISTRERERRGKRLMISDLEGTTLRGTSPTPTSRTTHLSYWAKKKRRKKNRQCSGCNHGCLYTR